MWQAYSQNSHTVQVCGRLMGEKEKWSNLNIIKRDVTRDWRGKRSSIL